MARKFIKYNLMIPGPTPIPTRVLAAMNHEMIGHRGPLEMSEAHQNSASGKFAEVDWRRD